jgi:uncharacterized surface protein with fasciclin (FAS1) repeats
MFVMQRFFSWSCVAFGLMAAGAVSMESTTNAAGRLSHRRATSSPAPCAVATASPAPTHFVGAEKDIVETAVGAGTFKTLVTAVKAAGLVETLQGKGPFTVFAPTDEAFAKLPKGTVEGLLKDKKALANVLTYHVVSGKVMAADVVKLEGAKTVQGESVAIAVKSGKVTINGVNVVSTDIVCKNGVIHVIDAVLLPPASKK